MVAAIELVSPGNKDREETRSAFAAKCAGYLQAGIGLVVIDIVGSAAREGRGQVVGAGRGPIQAAAAAAARQPHQLDLAGAARRASRTLRNRGSRSIFDCV